MSQALCMKARTASTSPVLRSASPFLPYGKRREFAALSLGSQLDGGSV